MSGAGGLIVIDAEGVADLVHDVDAFREDMTDAEGKAAAMLGTAGHNAGGEVQVQLDRISASLTSASQARVILVDHLVETLGINARAYLQLDSGSAEELAAIAAAVEAAG